MLGGLGHRQDLFSRGFLVMYLLAMFLDLGYQFVVGLSLKNLSAWAIYHFSHGVPPN